MSKIIRCDRCKRRLRNRARAAEWTTSITATGDVYHCPDCAPVDQIITCSRCQAQPSYADRHQWNVTMKDGRAVGYLCPACQTPEENAEAEINLATTDYGSDDQGRVIGWAKTGDDDQ